MHKEGTKGHALQYLAEHIGCTMEQTIAIGDAWNDREMIQAAGLGVAMGNAVPALKELADYVTLSNNEDGVKHVIEKFVLNAQPGLKTECEQGGSADDGPMPHLRRQE